MDPMRDQLIEQIKKLSGDDFSLDTDLDTASIEELKFQLDIIGRRFRLKFVFKSFNNIRDCINKTCPEDKKTNILLHLDKIQTELLSDNCAGMDNNNITVLESLYVLSKIQ